MRTRRPVHNSAHTELLEVQVWNYRLVISKLRTSQVQDVFGASLSKGNDPNVVVIGYVFFAEYVDADSLALVIFGLESELCDIGGNI